MVTDRTLCEREREVSACDVESRFPRENSSMKGGRAQSPYGIFQGPLGIIEFGIEHRDRFANEWPAPAPAKRVGRLRLAVGGYNLVVR